MQIFGFYASMNYALENWSLPTPQSGQTQSSGRDSNGAGSDSVVRIAGCGIVLVPAYITNVLCHKMLIFRELIF